MTNDEIKKANRKALPTFLLVVAICALLFDIGFLPSLVVCLVWMVNLSAYCKEAMRCSKAGNKIS